MDRRGVPLGHSRQGVNRQGGLEGSGSEQVKGARQASRQRRVQEQCVNDPPDPRGGHWPLGLAVGAGLARRWVSIVRVI